MDDCIFIVSLTVCCLYYIYTQKKKIVILKTAEEVEEALKCVQKCCVVGLDCEWIQNSKISLLQLAFPQNCLLIRMHLLDRVPTALRSLLESPRIRKAGVNVEGDAKKLRADFDVALAGAIDVRHLIPVANCDTACVNRFSLEGLYCSLCDPTPWKSSSVTRSNWEAAKLSRRQIHYASMDAIAGREIFLALLNDPEASSEDVVEFCNKANHLVPKKNLTGPCGAKFSEERRQYKAEKFKQYKERASRSRPCYDNCQMLNPSGELVSTCSRQTLKWYLKKNLATQVSEDVIQLNFEPSTKRHSMDHFYQEKKENRCVVCASEQHLIKYYVIPACYRRCFPVDLKSHSSHDILPMCHPCHDKAHAVEASLVL